MRDSRRKNKDAKKQIDDAHQNRQIKVPRIGTISYKDYDLPEMPSPTMVSIEGKQFDFKSSLRNPDFRSGKQYESLELKKICPNLYVKKFKVSRLHSCNTFACCNSHQVLTLLTFNDYRKKQYIGTTRSMTTSCRRQATRTTNQVWWYGHRCARRICGT